MQVRAFRATMVGVSVTLECVSLIVQGANGGEGGARGDGVCPSEGETRSCHWSARAGCGEAGACKRALPSACATHSNRIKGISTRNT